MLLYPKDAFPVVTTILGLGLAVQGIKHLFYYFTMARFMVDGRIILIIGVILLDMGLFAASLNDMPKIYIILYLVVIHAFSGLIGLLRALEAKRYGAKSWRLEFSHSAANIVMVVMCFVFIKNAGTVAVIYGITIIYTGIIRIITSFRKSTLVYIQ